MWRLLKQSFPDVRFRRQVPIQQYIADFVSHRGRVVVEIGGGQHSADKDAARTRTIEAEGFRILRIWNAEVLDNGEGCISRLAAFLEHDHPYPATTSTRPCGRKSSHPSPIKGEGR